MDMRPRQLALTPASSASPPTCQEEGLVCVDNEIRELQDQITPWTDRNFPQDTRISATLGLAEETGELARAALKQWQGLRGTAEEWDAEAAKEIGDVFIKLVHIAHLFEFDLSMVIHARWEQISQRDWTVNKTWHGLPS